MHIKSKWTTYIGVFMLIGCSLIGCGQSGAISEDELSALLSCGPKAKITLPTHPTTYEADIKPLLNKHCNGCHRAGGNAPFTFDTYTKAFALKSILARVTKTRQMPPWAPADCCNAYLKERRLHADEIATIQAWVQQGAPQGTPRTEVPQRKTTQTLRKDVVLKMPAPFQPTRKFGVSELRCFILDWPFKEKRFVTGFSVTPGNPKLVHHILVHIIPPEHVNSY